MKSGKVMILMGSISFIAGVYYKLSQKLGAGILMGFGLAILIYGYSITFINKDKRGVSDYLNLIGITLFSAFIFSLIQRRNFLEILSAAIVVTLIPITTNYITSKFK
jgi:uncharacterized membrane protein YjjP (DUF1212 family)